MAECMAIHHETKQPTRILLRPTISLLICVVSRAPVLAFKVIHLIQQYNVLLIQAELVSASNDIHGKDMNIGQIMSALIIDDACSIHSKQKHQIQVGSTIHVFMPIQWLDQVGHHRIDLLVVHKFAVL